MIDPTRLGNTIRGLRKKKNLSQTELAKIAGYTNTHLCRIELGKIKDISNYLMFYLATALDVDSTELILMSLDCELIKSVQEQIKERWGI